MSDQEQAVRDHRRAYLALELAEAEHIAAHPELDPMVRRARFRIEHRDEVERVANLAAEVEAQRVALEHRLCMAMEGVSEFWQLQAAHARKQLEGGAA